MYLGGTQSLLVSVSRLDTSAEHRLPTHALTVSALNLLGRGTHIIAWS